ncbi:MAG: DUF4864 domain-containing protein [Spirochaeta sp.]|nr:DUF4864 domain-containing protein [Spirochaeta sp.]
MARIRSHIFLFSLGMILLFATACRTSTDKTAAMISPSAELTPVDVVQLQLSALKEHGPSNERISQVFEFASPANKSATGPLERFATLFDGALYSGMINHQRAEILPAYVENNLAVVPVALIADDGTEWKYLFVLSRQQEEPYEDMWMTDAVQLESQPPQQLPPAAPQRII